MSDPKFSVVTFAREYGSGGAAIATRLAERLGYKLLDRALVERIAEMAKVGHDVAGRFDEHVDPWTRRLGRALRYGGFEAVSVVDGDAVDSDRVAALSALIVREAAAVGRCVIVGRGAQCLLRSQPDAFHVFIYAPREERARRLHERLGPGADVEFALDEVDRERGAYTRRYCGGNWLDPHLYHLMVNAALGKEAAVSTILTALGAGAPRPD
jgi:cytidylate kinase